MTIRLVRTNDAAGGATASDSIRLLRWVPTFESDKYGLELTGAPVSARHLVAILPDISRAVDGDRVAFVLVPNTFADADELATAIAAVSSGLLHARLIFVIQHKLLASIGPNSLNTKNAGLLLDLVDEDTPLSALMSGMIEAVRLEHDFAQRLSGSLKGALMLETLRNFAHESGLASLGPSMQSEDGHFGLPVRFDYVAENTIVDVLSRHRLT